MRQTGKKKDSIPWHQAFLIALVILLALLLVFSRGYRASRRVSVPSGQAEYPGKQTDPVSSDREPQSTYSMDEPFKAEQRSAPDHGPGAITAEMLLGQIDPAGDPDFVSVSQAHASRPGMFLRREAYDAFLQMHKAALADGISLTILSATRPFHHQKRIWEDKWNGRRVLYGDILAPDIEDPTERALEILRFSAMPGTSRHHWGTDIDLNSLQNAYFRTGEGKAVYDWLTTHALAYGFCQPYTAHGDRRAGGYEEEKWHWSYIPLSGQFLRKYGEQITYEDIRGFDGDTLAERLQVIEKFVLDINMACY